MFNRTCARLLAALLICAVAPAIAATLDVGAIYSSAQPGSQSFLRFHNTGTAAGSVAVTLKDYTSGQTLGLWTSPSIPAGSEQQYPISTIENGAGNFAKPSFYSIAVDTAMTGTFQHVLYRATDGTLTNLSTCLSGVTANQTTLSGVHTGLLKDGYPSSIVVNNTGTAAATVTLGIYDANTGTKRGTFTTPAVPANGQTIVTTAAIEADIGAPTSVMYHYVIKTESVFTGFLQHLVNNTQAGVTTDMTTTCRLDAVSVTAAASTLKSGAVFSGTQPTSQSFLRFTNTGASAGTVAVTLNNPDTGLPLGQWTSPNIPVDSEQQYPISRIESEVTPTFTKPSYYTINAQSGINGSFQHVLWRSADGTLTNLSTCSAGVTATRRTLSAVHSSLLQQNYPSTVVVHNTSTTASPVTLGIYDANTGTKRGTYQLAPIAASGQRFIAITEIEAAIGAPTPDIYHYVIKIEGAFTGYLQHLVNNTKAGVITDMTTTCGITTAAGNLTYVSGAGRTFGTACQPGQVGLDGYLVVCDSNTEKLRYALPEDLPPAPAGGYTSRPSWYPPLRDVFLAYNPPACPASGRVTLTHMIVDVDQLTTSTAQGAMIFDHVTPIDHAYVSIKPLDKPQAQRTEADYIPVFAPAGGEIIDLSLLGSPRSIRIVIAHGCETYSVIMVLNRLSGVLAQYEQELLSKGRVSTHINVNAGDKIGEQRDNPLDFAINDGAVWLSGYVAPLSYAAGEAWKPYTADVFPYFTPTLAAALESKMRRTVAPRWGKIDHDVAGTASGTWFLEGTVGYSGHSVESFRTATQTLLGGTVAGKDYLSWSHLTIARHWDVPENWVFSIGWWKNPKGDPVQYSMDLTGKPDPSTLTPSSGVVVYTVRQLQNTPTVGGASGSSGPIFGYVAIQVNPDETISIEPVPDVQTSTGFAGFTAAKRTYRR